MFSRAQTGLVHLLAATLCLWAAAYHTPVGALFRTVAAKMTGTRSSARPILAYYSGGVWELPRDEMNIESTPEVPDPQMLAAVPPGPALGRGVLVAYGRLSADKRKHAAALAARYGMAAS